MRVIIKKSVKSEKKMMAIFYEGDKKVKTTHFGSAGMEDFTKTRDSSQKQRYLARHKKNESWGKYMTAGSLSRYILWNLPTKQASILNYKKRFNLQ